MTDTTITYSGELLFIINNECPDLEIIKANWTANGCEALIKDKFDDQLYTLKIIPLHKKANQLLEKQNG